MAENVILFMTILRYIHILENYKSKGKHKGICGIKYKSCPLYFYMVATSLYFTFPVT